MKIDLRNWIQSKTFKYALCGIGVLLISLTLLKVGEYIGFKKASYSFQWGEGYYRSVIGRDRGQFGKIPGMNGDFLRGHGVAGPILKIASGALTIQDRDGAEKIILLTAETIVKRMRDTITVDNLKIGEMVAVIGSPNNSGQIEAKLIRVLPPPPSSATGTQSISQ